MKALLVLIDFAEVHINKNILASLINDNVPTGKHTIWIKIVIFGDSVCLTKEAIKGSKEGAPQREILSVCDINIAVHPPQDDWVYGQDKLWGTFQSPFNALKCGF
jgi:hypothetical protein